MTMTRVVGAVLVIAATVMLGGCFGEDTPPEQESASLVKTIDELQGEEVQLTVGQTLGVNTQDKDPGAYDAMILDGSIAAYHPSQDGSQPRIEAVAVGTTDVLLGDPDEGVDEVSFTLVVTK